MTDQQSEALVRLALEGEVGIITIAREAKRNAMNRAARNGLRTALDDARGRCKVIILTGSGGSFCSGIDLKERVEDQANGRDTAVQEWIDVNIAIRNHPAIVIAAVNGLALGGGTTLINVSDLAIAADTVQIGMPELGFATYPGLAGPSTQLSLGRKRAAWMILTTERIDGATAEAWGLVNRCVAGGRLLDEARAIADRIVQFDAAALTGCKQALDRIPASITDWQQAFSYGELTNAWIRSKTTAASEGLRRFGAGQKNVGQGRVDTTLEPTAGDPVDAAAAPGPAPTASGPLSGTAVTEWCGAASSDVTRVAVAFAGLLAARFGSEVTRLVPPSGDPLRAWPPLSGAASAFHRFLTGGKRVAPGTSPSTNSILLTDDSTLAASHSPRSVLIRPAWGADGQRVWSELTVQAASGLLDVFGTPSGRPLPMPGHQLAYATGMAAYNALAVMLFDERAGRPLVSAEVAVLDVALWINWKHFMASIRGTPGVGLDRAEEWRSVPCLDGYVALTFQDKDVVGFAKLTGDDFFLGADLGNRATRKKRLPAFNETFDRWAASRSRAEIVGAARKLGLPIGPVLRIEDLVSDAQLNARQFLALCQDGTRIPRLPLHWNGGPLGPPNQLCTPGSEAAVNPT